jgi:hypothetical protein
MSTCGTYRYRLERTIENAPLPRCVVYIGVNQSTADARDPVGPENDDHLNAIIVQADIVVPCWGPRAKVPRTLRYRYAEVESLLRACGKPVKAFGFSKDGDPLHPLMLANSTPFVDWK